VINKIQSLWKRRINKQKSWSKEEGRRIFFYIENLIVKMSLDIHFDPLSIAYDFNRIVIAISLYGAYNVIVSYI